MYVYMTVSLQKSYKIFYIGIKSWEYVKKHLHQKASQTIELY